MTEQSQQARLESIVVGLHPTIGLVTPCSGSTANEVGVNFTVRMASVAGQIAPTGWAFAESRRYVDANGPVSGSQLLESAHLLLAGIESTLVNNCRVNIF